MKAYTKLIYVTIATVSLLSCASVNQTTMSAETVVMLENHLRQSHKSSDLFNGIELLELDGSSKSSLISSVDRIALMNDRVFVLDHKGNKVVAFDNEGKFVASTARLIGNGRNEYIRLQDMAVDQDKKQVYLYCDAPYQLLILNYDLKVVKRIAVDYLAREICVDASCLYTLCHNLEQENVYELRCYDKSDLKGEHRLLVSYDKGIPGLFTTGKSVCSDGSRCLCCLPFDNRVYEVRNGNIDNVYNIDFNGEWFDHSQSKDLMGSAFIHQNIEKNWSIQNISFSDSIMVFNTNKSRSFYINLQNNTGAMYGMQKNDLFPFSVSTYTPCQSEEKGTAVITIPNEKVNDVLDLEKLAEKANEIIEKHLIGGKVVEEYTIGAYQA